MKTVQTIATEHLNVLKMQQDAADLAAQTLQKEENAKLLAKMQNMSNYAEFLEVLKNSGIKFRIADNEPNESKYFVISFSEIDDDYSHIYKMDYSKLSKNEFWCKKQNIEMDSLADFCVDFIKYNRL